MGQAAQRWSVTYTKHVKQKRKVCHDGFLELHSSNQKVVLYDEYDNLLASRFVKKEDVLEPGWSLAFDSYLVDISDECVLHKPASTLTCQENGKNVDGKSGSSYSQGSKTNPISIDTKPTFGRKKVRGINLSPSQRIIRDFKKNETNKYASSPSGLDMAKSSLLEWHVLYTTQLTQKAKKFHDGFLQLVVRGSQGRQVMLYDEYDKLLASRFVKKEDVIKSGESLTFDSYLVDIGDECERHKPVSTLTCQENSKTVGGKSGSSNNESENNPICIDRKPTFGRNKTRMISLSPSQNIMRDFQKKEMNKYASSPSGLDTTKFSTVEWQVLYTTQVTQKAKKFHDGFLELVVRGSQGRQVMLYDITRRLLESKFLKKNEIVSSGERLALVGHLVDIGEHEEDIKPVVDLNPQGRNYTIAGKSDTAHNQANIQLHKDSPAGKTRQKRPPRISTDLDSSSLKNDEAKFNWRTPADEPRRAAHDIMSILRKPMVRGKVETTGRSLGEEHTGSYSSDVHFDVESHVKLVHDCSIKILNSEAIQVLSNAVKSKDSEIQMPIASASVTRSNQKEEHEITQEISISKEIATETTTAVTSELSPNKLPEVCDDNKGSTSGCQEGASNEWTSHDICDVDEKTFERTSQTNGKDELPSFDLGF